MGLKLRTRPGVVSGHTGGRLRNITTSHSTIDFFAKTLHSVRARATKSRTPAITAFHHQHRLISAYTELSSNSETMHLHSILAYDSTRTGKTPQAACLRHLHTTPHHHILHSIHLHRCSITRQQGRGHHEYTTSRPLSNSISSYQQHTQSLDRSAKRCIYSAFSYEISMHLTRYPRKRAL